MTNSFDLQSFDNEMTVLLKYFEIGAKIHFVSLLFLNERNIIISLLMIHLKYPVVRYANLNSSSIKKPFLNYRPSNMLFRSFDYLFVLLSTRLLSKTLLKSYHFLIKNSKIHFKMQYITEY